MSGVRCSGALALQHQQLASGRATERRLFTRRRHGELRDTGQLEKGRRGEREEGERLLCWRGEGRRAGRKVSYTTLQFPLFPQGGPARKVFLVRGHAILFLAPARASGEGELRYSFPSLMRVDLDLREHTSAKTSNPKGWKDRFKICICRGHPDRQQQRPAEPLTKAHAQQRTLA